MWRYSGGCSRAEKTFCARGASPVVIGHVQNGGYSHGVRNSAAGRLFSADAADGVGGEGIVGPGVLGVAAAELFANFKIGVPPEAGQIGGQLDGLETG